MTWQGSKELHASTVGNDEYVLDAWAISEDQYEGQITIFRNFKPNAGVFKGEPLKTLRGASPDDLKNQFTSFLKQIVARE